MTRPRSKLQGPKAVGVALSLASSCLFALLYYYATLLRPLTAEVIFGWRMLLMLPCLTGFLWSTQAWGLVTLIGMRVRRKPLFATLLCISSALLGVQQWLFMWAPLHGRGLDVSLGYFLVPMVMLMIGRFVDGDRLTRIQKSAVAFAAWGVTNELYSIGRISWVTLMIVIGVPGYFLLRRRMATAHIGGLWFDTLISCPIACYFVFTKESAVKIFINTSLVLLLIGLAAISAGAFLCYTTAQRKISFSLFGLLSYLEPCLLVSVALALGERLTREKYMTYVPIWIAVALLAAEGVIRIIRAGGRKGSWGNARGRCNFPRG